MSSYRDTAKQILDLSRSRPDIIVELQQESDALLWEVEKLMLDDVERVDTELHDRVRDLALKLGLKQPSQQGWPRRTPAVLDLVYDCQWALRRLGRRLPEDDEEEEAL